MRSIHAFVVLCIFPALLHSQELVRIHGRVTDFGGRAIPAAAVRILDGEFHPVQEALSDSAGRFELKVPPAQSMALAAIRDSEYRTSRLEYWAWDIPVTAELEINPRYDRMEIYAMNAFRPQGGYPSYMMYFRPMSLSMLEAGRERDSSFLAGPVIDIAPRFTEGDLEVFINDQPVRILAMSRVQESGGNAVMFGYMIQCPLPEVRDTVGIDRIRIIATDRHSGDRGEGLLFVRRTR